VVTVGLQFFSKAEQLYFLGRFAESWWCRCSPSVVG